MGAVGMGQGGWSPGRTWGIDTVRRKLVRRAGGGAIYVEVEQVKSSPVQLDYQRSLTVMWSGFGLGVETRIDKASCLPAGRRSIFRGGVCVFK